MSDHQRLAEERCARVGHPYVNTGAQVKCLNCGKVKDAEATSQ